MPKGKAMIVAAQAEAAEAGAVMLEAGGNAVDAAIACALVQGVVDPLMAGISGFGSAGIYFPGKGFHQYLDFHAPAPAAAIATPMQASESPALLESASPCERAVLVAVSK